MTPKSTRFERNTDLGKLKNHRGRKTERKFIQIIAL